MAIPELGDPKDPAAVRDYTFDWSANLADEETIATSAWAIVPAVFGVSPLEVVSTDIDADGKITRVYLGGGDAGKFYEIANTITTTADPTEDVQRFILYVQER